ncbi:MAG: hypothetical protein KDJ44_08160 [Rhodoblastus sp.]|nr:hypothetical protein [Amphiplicatus sp.]MCB1534690.1 hypothetical protein [Rhodoblastus sp.]
MKATVWTIQIQRVAEETLDVCGNKAQAFHILKTFLDSNWHRLHGMPMPVRIDAAAKTYFDARPDESFAIIGHEIELPDAA